MISAPLLLHPQMRMWPLALLVAHALPSQDDGGDETGCDRPLANATRLTPAIRTM